MTEPFPFADGDRVRDVHFTLSTERNGTITDVGDGEWGSDVAVRWDGDDTDTFEHPHNLEKLT